MDLFPFFDAMESFDLFFSLHVHIISLFDILFFVHVNPLTDMVKLMTGKGLFGIWLDLDGPWADGWISGWVVHTYSLGHMDCLVSGPLSVIRVYHTYRYVYIYILRICHPMYHS